MTWGLWAQKPFAQSRNQGITPLSDWSAQSAREGAGARPKGQGRTCGPRPPSSGSKPTRGVIDGDGCIRKWRHTSAKTEQWSLRIYGGSLAFLSWLSAQVEKLFGVTGRIHAKSGKNDFVLKYGKLAAQVILAACYRPGEFALPRKFLLAQECGHAKSKWSKSVTRKCPSGEIGIHTGLKLGSPLR